ncbi:MAG: hypothetical protein ACI9ZH_000969 [Paracoccaceae bacterium]|jgi:hypothetical protein
MRKDALIELAPYAAQILLRGGGGRRRRPRAGGAEQARLIGVGAMKDLVGLAAAGAVERALDSHPPSLLRVVRKCRDRVGVAHPCAHRQPPRKGRRAVLGDPRDLAGVESDHQSIRINFWVVAKLFAAMINEPTKYVEKCHRQRMITAARPVCTQFVQRVATC